MSSLPGGAGDASLSAETGFRVLEAVADRSEWLQAWDECGREPFAHPTYVSSFALEGATACCAVLRCDRGTAVLPLVIRPVRTADRVTAGNAVDAISPYGYGGPYRTPGADVPGLWASAARWMRERGVVSFFGRLALHDDVAPPPDEGIVVASDSQNVVVDLTRGAEEQWQAYDHKVRKNVNKARRSHLSVEVRDTFADVAEFSRLYLSTMDRRQAAASYYFDVSFFARIAAEMAGSHVVAEVRDETGTLVSAELVLVSDRYLYSYLGGTLSTAFDKRPNDLLKHAVIEHGRATGRLGYVLGGGLAPDDGIFRYKRSFDRTGCVDFRRVMMICDADAYRALLAERTAPAGLPEGGHLDPEYFPAYRAPVVREAPTGPDQQDRAKSAIAGQPDGLRDGTRSM